jgi:hypothetical protein
MCIPSFLVASIVQPPDFSAAQPSHSQPAIQPLMALNFSASPALKFNNYWLHFCSKHVQLQSVPMYASHPKGIHVDAACNCLAVPAEISAVLRDNVMRVVHLVVSFPL